MGARAADTHDHCTAIIYIINCVQVAYAGMIVYIYIYI